MIQFGEIVKIVIEEVVTYFKVITRNSFDSSEKILQ
jgi:hypothetical protein